MEELNVSKEIGVLSTEVKSLKELISQINSKLDNVVVEGSFKSHFRDNMELLERDGYFHKLYKECKSKHDGESMSKVNSFMNIVRNVSSIVILIAPLAYIVINSILK